MVSVQLPLNSHLVLHLKMSNCIGSQVVSTYQKKRIGSLWINLVGLFLASGPGTLYFFTYLLFSGQSKSS